MPSLAFLFWNLNRQPLEHRVARMVAAHAVDVVVLAECETASAQVVAALNSSGSGPFAAVPRSGSSLRFYDRTNARWRRVIRDTSEAWLGFVVDVPGIPPFMLFGAHLPSKLWATEDDQVLAAIGLADDIRQRERKEGHERTILVGDLNVNPFEKAAAWAGALHAVSTREVARREVREIRGREYPLFYNPMWGFLGDRTPGPPGTYYRSSCGSVNYFWNAYDQVLLRPELMDRLAEIEILTSDGSVSLLTQQGLPDRTNGSDHLPLYFRLDW